MPASTHRAFTTAIVSTLALLGATASAQDASPHYMVLSPGIGGPEGQDGGPGNEQADTVWLQKGEDVYLVTVYQNSDTFGPYWQCKCNSVKLSPGAEAPEVVAADVQLTHNYFVGDRPCNHPRLATDGERVVLLYGSNFLTANTQTYATVLDETCGMESAVPLRISANANNNEGAPDIQYVGNGVFAAGYLSTGGQDISYARGLRLLGDSLVKDYLTGVVTPANIGRPTIAVSPGESRALFCSARGDQRPPEMGVQCAWLDTNTGDILWKTYLAESEPYASSYMNQPQATVVGPGRFAVQIVESDGGLKKKSKDVKGASTEHLYLVDADDAGMTVRSQLTGIGLYQAHPTICSGAYGLDGATHVGVFDASVTGNGQPGLQMVSIDDGGDMVVDLGLDNWVVSPWGDSGHLQNLYGANPNDQGRGFLRCRGGVPNPSFGMEGGFKSGVRSFFVAPHTGRRPGEPKNALVLSMVPGEVAEPAPPEPPTTNEPSGSSAATGAGPEPEGSGGAPANGVDDDGSGEGVDLRFEQPSACATSRGTPGGSSWAWLSLAAGLLAARRRREDRS